MKKITLIVLLFVANVNAQSVGGYLFSQATEIYVPVVGTNSSANGDDGDDNSIPIGFNFSYGGATYSTFSISTNGFIRLGNQIAELSYVNALSLTSTQSPLIAAFWDDHNRNTGSIQYLQSGISPTRVLEIGWDNINLANGGVANDTRFGSFKIKLHESTGQIEFIYGPNMDTAGQFTASVGLNDLTSFLSISPTSVTATSSNTIADNVVESTEFLLGQKFIFTPQPQCSGMPNVGNTNSSSTAVCSNFPFDLSLQNQIPGFGISYQWQISTSGSNFVNIENANNAFLTIAQTAESIYQCVVSCGTLSTISTPITITMSNVGSCFCFPSYTNGKTDGDLISNVVITGTSLSNNTGTIPENPSYTYFTGQPNLTATLQVGYSYDLNVTVGTYQQQNIAAWIDYNDDAIFSLDERVGFSLTEIGSNETGVIRIIISCSAVPGLHRIRIRDVWNTDSSSIDACANYGYGETEDYDVTIEVPLGCQAPFDLNTGSLSSNSAELVWSPGCNQANWDIHLTAMGGGIPVGLPSNPNVDNPFFAFGLTPFTSYDFYVRAICADPSISNWAGPFTFTTLAVAVSNDDCETAIPLTIGTTFEEYAVVGTNVGATKTIGPPNPTCAIFAFGGDVWYSVVVPPDGNMKLEVRQDPGSLFIDSGLTAFRGTCTGLIALGCSDDEGIGGFSLLNLSGLTPGETIYARVWEFANDTFGTFQFSAYSPTLAVSNFEKSKFRFYPNPVKDVLNLSYDKNISNVIVFNLLGQEVLSMILKSNQIEIDMSYLPSGIYIVRANSENLEENIRVIKE